MLKIPVYLRGSSYYFHTRIAGKQFKKSLHTACKDTARIKALHILATLTMALDPKQFNKYHIDLANGVFQASDEDDHKRMIEALGQMKDLGVLNPKPTTPAPSEMTEAEKQLSIRIMDLVEEYFKLKSHLRSATVGSYRTIGQELSDFLSNPFVHKITVSDITRFQNHLARHNTARTIDNKVAVVRTLINFAKKQGYYFAENPAKDRNLMSKRDKDNGGYVNFHFLEVQSTFHRKYYQVFREKDHDFYLATLLVLTTGARVSEITDLKANHVLDVPVPHIRIVDSKTKAGIREVPIPQPIYDEIKTLLPSKGRLFRYIEREGKGSGGPVSKKFTRLLIKAGVHRPKLCLHSLRQFFNNSMLNEKVMIEMRCQLVGHEINNVNISNYTEPIPLETLAPVVLPVQEKILKLIQFGYK